MNTVSSNSNAILCILRRSLHEMYSQCTGVLPALLFVPIGFGCFVPMASDPSHLWNDAAVYPSLTVFMTDEDKLVDNADIRMLDVQQ